ncbi:phosphoribosylamine--glycine ligase [Gemmatimonadetes bacterium T265]|nr:phosphoribosylamine--glycine ligase [Gemmatimonadetes bacterium T265]
MKVLLVGSGGREHALAWKLAREGAEVVAAPGNPGLAALGRCVPARADDLDALVALAEVERPDYTLVGPEAPLALGIVDRFRARGLPVFGPTAAAARIETSKAWAKRLMLGAGVPTARASTHTDPADAKRAAHALGAPVVVKASGLAAGKGVVVAETLAAAAAAIDDMLVGNRYGAAGAEVLVEEFMEGEELSLFFVTDGETAVPLPAAQDHKRLLAGDHGPNTGGMGAYAPAARADVAAEVDQRIVGPTLAAMRAAGTPFTGLLYAGLMLTRDGPRVVEFNCRFGDPETQAVLPLMDALGSPLGPMIAGSLGLAAPRVVRTADDPPAAVTTVLAAAGYPDAPRTGDPITLPADLPDGVTIFHAGTARDASGQLVTAGGRVLAVTAVAETFARAQALSRETAARVEFAGKQYRDDIGWREAARHEATRPA